MKNLLLIFVTVLLTQKSFAQEWLYCMNEGDIYTIWPYWEDNRNFVKCGTTPGTYFVLTCPPPLLFSFHYQVCVWDWQWEEPPPQDEITARPTSTTSVSSTLPVNTDPITIEPTPSTTTEDTTMPIDTNPTDTLPPSPPLNTNPITIQPTVNLNFNN